MKIRKQDPEHRARLIAGIRAWNAIPENRLAVVKRNQSVDHRAKVSTGMMGHKVSASARRKLSEKALIRWRNKEFRIKVAVGMRKAVERKKREANE